MFPSRLASVLGKGALENNYSVSFDGTDDNIALGSAVNLGTTASYAFWSKRTDTSNRGSVLGVNEWGGSLSYVVNFDGTTDKYFRVDDNYVVFEDYVSVQDTWEHYVFTRSGTAVKMYVDGALKETETGDGDFSSVDSELQNIGAKLTAGTDASLIILDEVAIYNKALSAGDISALYQAKGTSDLNDDGNSANLQGWWRMGDGTLDDFNLIADQVNPTLGSECVANGNFQGDASLWNQTHAKFSIDETNDYASYADGADGSLIQTDGDNLVSIVASKIYKIQFTISEGSGDAKVHLYSYNLNHHLLAEDTYADGFHTVYALSPSPYEGGFTIRGKNSGSPFNITDISVKEVNGNPGLMTNMASDDIVKDTP